MKRLWSKFVGLFRSEEQEKTDPGAGEEVTRKNVDRQTHRIQAKAVMARLRLKDVERRLEPPGCQET